MWHLIASSKSKMFEVALKTDCNTMQMMILIVCLDNLSFVSELRRAKNASATMPHAATK
jgi:hypothetical protein